MVRCVDYVVSCVAGPLAFGLPESGTVYDYFISADHKYDWARWSDAVDAFNYDPEQPYFNILVPTADTKKFKCVSLEECVISLLRERRGGAAIVGTKSLMLRKSSELEKYATSSKSATICL